jgi:hypothetical protein
VKRRRGRKQKKPDKPKPAEAQPPRDVPFGANVPIFETHRTDGQHAEEQQQAGNAPLRNDTPTKESTLSHERPSVLKQERERLTHNRTPFAPVISVAPKRRKHDYHKEESSATDSENQTSQNATFEISPEASPLVHDDALPPNVNDAESPAVAAPVEADVEIPTASPVIGEEHRAPDKVVGRDSKTDSISGEGSVKKTDSKLNFGDESVSSAAPDSVKPAKQTKTGKKLEKAERKVACLVLPNL